MHRTGYSTNVAQGARSSRWPTFAALAVLLLGLATIASLPLVAPGWGSAGAAQDPNGSFQASSTHTFPTPIHHVFVIVLENAKRSTVLSNGPFEKGLQTTYSYASHYYAICHPSAPNYLALTSGATYQCGSDNYNKYNSKNIGDVVGSAALTWASFSESMPKACDTSNSYPYAVKHNPLVYYTDIVSNTTKCSQHDLTFSSWTSDVKAGTMPNLGFITPNLTDDGHDTSVATADTWLKGWLSPLMKDPFYNSSVFFVTYDESVNDNSGYNGTAGGNVFFAAVSPYAKAGYDQTTNASHYNLLATIEWLLGVGNTGHNDSSSKFPAMKQLFSFPTGKGGVVTNLSASATVGIAPMTVAFGENASGGATPYTYAWSFGDGLSSSLELPSHTFATAGTYNVSLTVHDASGGSAQQAVQVTVGKPVAGTAATLIGGSPVAVTPSTFWSLGAQTDCTTCIATNPSVTSFLNATPFGWVRYGSGTDECNITTNTMYGNSGVPTGGCAFNLSSLKSWCNGRTPHCHAILSLPGENNNSAEDAAIAQWIVKTIGFQPDYWSIGNEPTGWTHYGRPWTKWQTTDSLAPTPLAYAFDVKAAIAAVKVVDPTAKFIGIESACECNTQWLQDVVAVNGPNLAAIAYHNYPSTGSTSVNLAQFYSTLASTSNVSAQYAGARSAILGHCGQCATLPIFVNEFNAGPGWAPSNYGGTYANAVFLAASIAQALEANVSQLTIFNLQTSSTSTYGFSMMNGHSTVGPTGLLFSDLLSHMATGQVYSTKVATTVPNVWAVETRSGSSESLLVVNANLTHAVALSLGTSLGIALAATEYLWSPGNASPTTSAGLLNVAYSIPAQGILLLTTKLGLAPVAATGAVASEGGVPRLLSSVLAALPHLLFGGVVAPGLSLAVPIVLPARPIRRPSSRPIEEAHGLPVGP